MRAPAFALTLLAIALFVAGCGGPEDSDAKMAAACERQIEEVAEITKESAGSTPVAPSTTEAVENEHLVECAGQKPEESTETVVAAEDEKPATDAGDKTATDEPKEEPKEEPKPEEAPAELDEAARGLFTTSCGGCHTLSDAEATGAVGPNLDDTTLDAAGIEEMILNGKGGMPAGLLTGDDATAVAAYVAAAAAL